MDEETVQVDNQKPKTEESQVAAEDSKKDAQTAEQIRHDQATAAHNELVHPSRKFLHKVFILISFVTALTAVCLLIGQVLAIIYEDFGPIQYTLTAYLILCSLLILFNELQWTFLTRDSKILGVWLTRGLFYAFVAVITLEQNDESATAPSNGRAYRISMAYVKAVAYTMMGCGALYFLMGLICMHRVYDGLVEDYMERRRVAQRLRKSGTAASVAPPPTDVERGGPR